jgi:nitric oxide dioxygenase
MMTAPPVTGMSARQIEIVKSTVPVIQHHGLEISKVFYVLLLEEHPELRRVFDPVRQANGEQPLALAVAILAYDGNLDRFENLEPSVQRVAYRHCHFRVSAEHYPIVGDVLMRSMKSVLGDVAHPEMLDAWSAAYFRLAETMIEMENSLYRSSSSLM